MIRLEDITQKAAGFLEQSPLNKVAELGLERIYELPLVGLAAASDPLYKELKNPEAIGPAHMSPEEWLPEAETVISYFLPFSIQIRQANHIPGLPATEWLYGRIEGEACNTGLRQFLIDEIQKAGGKAIAPPLDTRFSIINKRSNWSERHTAFIAGLGTFGLSKSLITIKGCAGRYGSIVTSLKMVPTPRPYQDPYQYCPGVTEGACLACIPRCATGAISEQGKDVEACSSYLDNTIRPSFKPRYGCGKCQTAVPCEHALP
jgi:epoxyqueuosine reductase QueG